MILWCQAIDAYMAVHEAASNIVMLIAMKHNLVKALEKQKTNDGADGNEEESQEMQKDPIVLYIRRQR
eukprot:12724257-Ditylum_brightwellii.AAC.1